MIRYIFFFSSRRRHTRCALVTGVQTCALPICAYGNATVHERPLLTLWYMPHWNTMSPGMQARAMMGYMRNDDIVTPERPLTPLDWTPELRTRVDDAIGRASCRERVCQYV